jgi:hypothetical protein
LTPQILEVLRSCDWPMPGPFSLTGSKMPWVRGWCLTSILYFQKTSACIYANGRVGAVQKYLYSYEAIGMIMYMRPHKENTCLASTYIHIHFNFSRWGGRVFFRRMQHKILLQGVSKAKCGKSIPLAFTIVLRWHFILCHMFNSCSAHWNHQR